MKLGRTPSAAKRKDLGVIHKGVHSLRSRKVEPATITSVCRPTRYEPRELSRSGILSSGSGAVVVVEHAPQPLPALHFTCGAARPRLWAGAPVPQSLMIAFPA